MTRAVQSAMRPRRGFAMLAAMWLVIAIAAVALQFSIEARERRLLGINTAERGKGRAAAIGALNATQAALEASLRQSVSSGASRNAALRGSDPWLDVDSLFSGVILVDSIPVDVSAHDLGTQLDLNALNEARLRTFLQFALKDFSASDQLAQAILDWRDVDSIARSNGAERDAYIKEGRLVLPSNQPFREVSDLLDVAGMTPEIYDRISPFLTTHGSGTINVNVADTLVLRALPGMTDQILIRILAIRSAARIQSVQQVLPPERGGVGARGGGGRGGAGAGGQPNASDQQLIDATTVNTTEVEFVFTAYVGPQRLPVRLNAILTRSGQNSTITWKSW